MSSYPVYNESLVSNKRLLQDKIISCLNFRIFWKFFISLLELMCMSEDDVMFYSIQPRIWINISHKYESHKWAGVIGGQSWYQHREEMRDISSKSLKLSWCYFLDIRSQHLAAMKYKFCQWCWDVWVEDMNQFLHSHCTSALSHSHISLNNSSPGEYLAKWFVRQILYFHPHFITLHSSHQPLQHHLEFKVEN